MTYTDRRREDEQVRYANEQSFRAALKGGECYPVYLLCGGEPYLIEKWAATLLGSDSGSPFNAQRFDGTAPDIRAVWDALEALPLLMQEKTVLLSDLEPTKLSEDGLAMLAELTADIPQSSRLIITAKSPAFVTGATGKKLIKLIDEHGAVVQLATPGQAELVKFLQTKAKKQGCQLENPAAKHLLNICPADMHLLAGELDKVCAFVGEGEITRQAIDALVTPKTEASAFDLQRLILRGNIKGALELIARLLYLREEPIAIVAALAMGFCDLYRAKAACNAGQSLAGMVSAFGYKSEYRARKAFESATMLNIESARRASVLIRESERMLKSTGVSGKICLEQLTVRLAALCGEGGR